MEAVRHMTTQEMAVMAGIVLFVVVLLSIRSMWREWLAAKYGRDPRSTIRHARERRMVEDAVQDDDRNVAMIRRREKAQIGVIDGCTMTEP